MISTEQKQIKGIEELVLAGLQKQINKYFGVEAKLTTYADGYEVFARKPDRTPSYPFAFTTLESVSFDQEDMYRSVALANKYLSTPDVDADGKMVEFTSIVPAMFEMTMHYITTDIQTLIRFIAIWGFCNKKSKLDFNILYRGTEVCIRITPDGTLGVPKKETAATTAGAMEMEGTLRVNCYMSSPRVEDNPKLPVFTSIELSVFAQHNDAPKGKDGILDYNRTIPIKKRRIV